MKAVLTLVLAIGLLVLLLTACSSNEAKSYVPKASELCCHGSWKVLKYDGEADDSPCSKGYQETYFPSAHACWQRSFYNAKIRPGEAEDLDVGIGVMRTPEEAENWLSNYSPSAELRKVFEFEEASPPYVGDEAKAWEYWSDITMGTLVVFRRENVAVSVYVDQGTRQQREIMVESVDQAVLDRFLEWE